MINITSLRHAHLAAGTYRKAISSCSSIQIRSPELHFRLLKKVDPVYSMEFFTFFF